MNHLNQTCAKLHNLMYLPASSSRMILKGRNCYNLFHLRPLAYCEIVFFTTTSGLLPKHPPFFAPTCDPRSHDQKSPIFVSGRMGTSAQKMYPTPLVKAVMVMLLTNLVASKGKINPYAPIQSCQLLPFVLLLFSLFGSTIFLSYPGLVLDSPLFAKLTLLEVS